MKKLIFILSIIFLISCEKEPFICPIKEIIINRDLRPEFDFSIETASIQDSTFTILANYPESDFDLIFNGLYLKSLPLQVNLFLVGNTNKIYEKPICSELKFNISKLKQKDHNTIIINLFSYHKKLIFNY